MRQKLCMIFSSYIGKQFISRTQIFADLPINRITIENAFTQEFISQKLI